MDIQAVNKRLFNDEQESIEKHKKLLHEEAQSKLLDRIIEHNDGVCDCDKNFGLCYAGQWLNGQITDKQVVEESKLWRS